MMPRDDTKARGLQWRAVFSVVAVFGWLIFLVIWLFFIASNFSALQNLAVLLVSFLLFLGSLIGVWVSWGLRYTQNPVPPPGYAYGPRFDRRRSTLNGIAVIAWLTFLVIWLFFFATDFSLYQNLGAILASVLVIGGTVWAISLAIR
jgi:hypothetical protein